MKSKKSKIILIVIISIVAAALVAGGIVAVIMLNKNDNTCTEHIDANSDGICDVCGKPMPNTQPEEKYEDKVEAISKFNITVSDGEGYIVTAPEYVIKGNALTFSVKFSNYFDITDASVNVNGNAVTPAADGTYTVKNVQEDIEITVSGIIRTHYGVIKSTCLGAKISGEDKVAVDGDYTFTLDIADCATGTATVKANGEVITAKDGLYTVSKPNKDVIIEVSGLTVPTVDVTYDDTKGYSIEYYPTMVGESFNFSVHIDSEYENHIPLVVKVNGVTVKAVNGVYTVTDAPQNINIAVSGVVLREKITVTFVNCDLSPISIYKAAAWQEVIPTREGYIFNGWKDQYGSPIEFDYMSDITLYASWITEDGIDYIDELPKVANKINDRLAEIGNDLWRYSVVDMALAEQYAELLEHHTDYEQNFVSADSTVEDYIAKTKNVSSVIIGKNNFFGANENAVKLYFTANGEYQNKGASTLREFAAGHEMDGIEYNIQNKNDDNSLVLDYSLEFGKINFKKLCEENGKVTFWLSTNAPGLRAETENDYLFFSAELNTALNTNKKYALYRVDVQDGGIYLNGEYIFDMSEATYNGETEFTIDIHRLDVPDHQYAYIHVSNIYTGARDESLVKVPKTSQVFDIINILSGSYVDTDNGLTELPRTDISKLFGELGGEYFNIQKPHSDAENLVLDYSFTISAFNYKRYCEKYGSVSFKVACNYAGTTISIGNTLLGTSTADTPITVTIQDGSVFVNGVYKCDLSAEIYGGEADLVLDVHRPLENAQWAAFHISNLEAGPKDTTLVK